MRVCFAFFVRAIKAAFFVRGMGKSVLASCDASFRASFRVTLTRERGRRDCSKHLPGKTFRLATIYIILQPYNSKHRILSRRSPLARSTRTSHTRTHIMTLLSLSLRHTHSTRRASEAAGLRSPQAGTHRHAHTHGRELAQARPHTRSQPQYSTRAHKNTGTLGHPSSATPLPPAHTFQYGVCRHDHITTRVHGRFIRLRRATKSPRWAARCRRPEESSCRSRSSSSTRPPLLRHHRGRAAGG